MKLRLCCHCPLINYAAANDQDVNDEAILKKTNLKQTQKSGHRKSKSAGNTTWWLKPDETHGNYTQNPDLNLKSVLDSDAEHSIDDCPKKGDNAAACNADCQRESLTDKFRKWSQRFSIFPLKRSQSDESVVSLIVDLPLRNLGNIPEYQTL